MKKIIFTFLLLHCSLLIVNAQPQTEWVKRYSDPNNHNVNFVDMVLDKFGNVFISGYITVDSNNKDILTLKYDNNGNLKWVRTYDSPDHKTDVPNKIAVDNSGNVIVAGYSLKTNGVDDYFVIKYASNGDSLWSSRISYQSDTLARANAVAVDDSDNVYVVGFFNIMWSGASIFSKYNKYGIIQWIKYYGLNDTLGNDGNDIVVSKNGFNKRCETR